MNKIINVNLIVFLNFHSKNPEISYDVEDIVTPAKLHNNNAVQAWREQVHGVPWSYSSSSKVIEDVKKISTGPETGRYKRKMAVVMTGNTNLHDNRDSRGASSNLHNLMSYDCRIIVVDGQLVNQNCLGRTRRKSKRNTNYLG